MLLCVLWYHPAVADWMYASEPNDTPATATLTSGRGNLDVGGALDSGSDRDYFTFRVAAAGVPNPPYSVAVRIQFSTSPVTCRYALTGPDGLAIFAGTFTGPYAFDFNPNASGGIGIYTIEVSALSAQSVGPYQFSVFGVADGGGQPPLVEGTFGEVNIPDPHGVPSLSPFGLLLLAVLVYGAAIARLNGGTR